MKSPRTVTIAVTFVAGLYFILDFVVPPTLPGLSTRGVALTTSPASFTVEVPSNRPATYLVAKDDPLRPQILVAQRDVMGQIKLVPTTLRQIGPGSVVTMRRGPFEVKAVNGPTILTQSGATIQVEPGSGSFALYDPATGRRVRSATAGQTLQFEQRDAKVLTTDPGSIELIENGRRATLKLGRQSVVMKLSRYGAGTEIQLDGVRPGDTVQIGPNTYFADNRDAAAQFNLVITTMAFGIGLFSLGMVNGQTLVKRRSGWYLSAFFFGAVILGVAAGIGKYDDPGTKARAFSDFVVVQIIASVTSTVFSLLAFYMATAAYRVFRVRTGEAALMMVSALIVMIGQTPFGSYLTSWMGERYSSFWLPNIAAWILRVPNTGVFRGLVFGVMMGAFATALRYWLSMERMAGD
ncbi:MAG: hypothetical protein P4L46_03125 [Fimbriimonas sp.]|nr:hypothetical protein [Fimbriimonas sp.]